MSDSLGMRVRVVWSEDCPWHKEKPERAFRNVTEIHWNYNAESSSRGDRKARVAFESDIHGTGSTYDVDWIAEFEATVETEQAPEF